nr:MAG TPA: hypothetical protein [Caudoviricetes sp.]
MSCILLSAIILVCRTEERSLSQFHKKNIIQIVKKPSSFFFNIILLCTCVY